MDKTFHIDGDFLQEDARESFGRADHWNTESEAEHQSAEEAAHERAKTLARYPLAPGMEWQKTTGIKETEFEVGMCNCAIGQNCPFVAEKWFTTCKVAVPLPPPVAEERTQVYRCGWCGNICDKDGNNIEVPGDTTGYDKATDIQGKCCNHEVWDDAFTNAPLRVAERTEDWLKERYYITKK